MEKIESLDGLKKMLRSNEIVWLLLYKEGSSQSECALENYKKAALKADKIVHFYADVNVVRDIHPEYKITSVPSLLNFEKGLLKNVVKGCHQPEQFNAIFEKIAFVSSIKTDGKPQKNVTVYTTPTCSWCNTIKRHLQEHGVRYREVDVSADQKSAEEMVKKSGQQGVPQTDINGEIIVGFDKNRINSLLGIN